MNICRFFIACSLVATLSAAPKSKGNPVYEEELNPPALKNNGMTYGCYADWLYLQPNGSNFYYGIENIILDPNIAVPTYSPNWNVLEVDPDYHCGFILGTSARFDEANVCLDLNWERLRAQDSDHFQTPSSTGFLVGPVFDAGAPSTVYNTAQGTMISHFDAVNLTVGKQVYTVQSFYADLYGGLGFTRIEHISQAEYTNAANATQRICRSTSLFTGAGPQIGIDYNYRLYKEFFLTGNSSFALLMGQMKNNTRFQSSVDPSVALGVPQPNVQKLRVPDRSQLVAGLEQKLGLFYRIIWKGVTATIAAGYQCQIYLDAVQSFDLTSPQVAPVGLGTPLTTTAIALLPEGFERTISNFILTGPYAFLGVEF